MPASVATPAFWRGYLHTARPYLLAVSGAAGLVGVAARGASGVGPWLVAGALFLTYGFGQALTDVFQTDTDALSAPDRPLVRGEIARRDVLAVSIVGLAGCSIAVGAVNPWALGPAVVAVALLASYSAAKRRWWAGPPWNSAAVAMLPLIGWMSGGGTLADALGTARVRWLMAAVALTYGVFVLVGYLKDVEADAATGYRTFAVRFGRRAAVGFSALWAAGGVACLWPGVPWDLSESPLGAAWAAIGAVALLGGHGVAWAVTRDADAHPAVELSVLAFVTLHLGVAAAFMPSLGTWVGALVLLTLLGLRLRPTRTQV